MRLKSLLSSVLLAVSLVANACWFTEDNFNGNYIAFLTGDIVHYSPTAVISNATYYNGQTVAMPFTVFVKVSNRFDEESGSNSIKRAILQYKVLPNGEWVTVKDINNPDWDMDFQNPVALFGRNTINIPGLENNTEILIRLYLSDGIYETGNLSSDISGDAIPDVANGPVPSEIEYSGGWTAPFVMRVKVSDKIRPTR